MEGNRGSRPTHSGFRVREKMEKVGDQLKKKITTQPMKVANFALYGVCFLIAIYSPRPSPDRPFALAHRVGEATGRRAQFKFRVEPGFPYPGDQGHERIARALAGQFPRHRRRAIRRPRRRGAGTMGTRRACGSTVGGHGGNREAGRWPAAAAAPPGTAPAARGNAVERRRRRHLAEAGSPARAALAARSAFLISSQFAFTSAADATETPPKTCGCRRISFAASVSATSSIVNPPSNGFSEAILAWKSAWNMTSPISSRSPARSPPRSPPPPRTPLPAGSAPARRGSAPGPTGKTRSVSITETSSSSRAPAGRAIRGAPGRAQTNQRAAQAPTPHPAARATRPRRRRPRRTGTRQARQRRRKEARQQRRELVREEVSAGMSG